ncbi:hypothetical protein BABINDRAFT_172025 [Babjeviella inositovora NRRL Y-12698]|uniref:Lysophospholipase n=1 Tax=Babjeviella inositovora NRRL Y-12698 TaxID=984486 RepID=A0A1E3QMH8_9ASCO|nr:uncharacterized protein BABINDRAFT_172025 [Babjeviella inositovora NRRL Y-12698]ODQ78664.1 hypothetical protein BABINDRAFT_172025 [Babjeviella inositovora NRRL Y-12698]
MLWKGLLGKAMTIGMLPWAMFLVDRCEPVPVYYNKSRPSKHDEIEFGVPRKYLNSSIDINRLQETNSSYGWLNQSMGSVRSNTYAPYTVLCPTESLVRPAKGLRREEEEYIANRQKLTQHSVRSFLHRVNITNFDYDGFLLQLAKPITLGIAISGGGYRAMLTGAGVLAALDERTQASEGAGHLGGLLQSASYISGTSGGSWLIMSLVFNDYRPVELMMDEPLGLWDFEEPLLEGLGMAKAVESVPVSAHRRRTAEAPNSDGQEEEHAPGVGGAERPTSIQTGCDITRNNTWDMSEKDRYNKLTLKPRTKRDLWTKLGVRKSSNGTESESFFFEMLKTFLPAAEAKNETEFTTSSLKKVFAFYRDIQLEVRPKKLSGFYISLTDYWGRALAGKILPRGSRSPGTTFSSIPSLSSFQKYHQPFPIVSANAKWPSKKASNLASYVLEFTPYEFGSWDSHIRGFTDLRFLGTMVDNGVPVVRTDNANVSLCTAGFDNAGFIAATSSSLFNVVLMRVWELVNTSRGGHSAVERILAVFGLSSARSTAAFLGPLPDYALYTPNPFYGYSPGNDKTEQISTARNLYLVDGGEDGQNIPFQPLLQKERAVDMIFALDMTSDIDNWPNGTALALTAQRFHANFSLVETPRFYLLEKGVPVPTPRAVFPQVPSMEEMVECGFNKKPVFFGCYIDRSYPELALATTSEEEIYDNTVLPPLIVYLPNSQYTYLSNTSTFQLSYSSTEMRKMVENGYGIATAGNSTADESFTQCVGCAMVKREFDRIAMGVSEIPSDHFSIPETCLQCYSRYCYIPPSGVTTRDYF